MGVTFAIYGMIKKKMESTDSLAILPLTDQEQNKLSTCLPSQSTIDRYRYKDS